MDEEVHERWSHPVVTSEDSVGDQTKKDRRRRTKVEREKREKRVEVHS